MTIQSEDEQKRLSELARLAVERQKSEIINKGLKGAKLTNQERKFLQDLAYSEDQTKPDWVRNKVELCEALSDDKFRMNRVTLDRLLLQMFQRDGREPKRANGEWDVRACMRAMIDFNIRAGFNKEGTQEIDDMTPKDKANLRLLYLRIEREEREMARDLGDLIHAKDVARMIEETFAFIRHSMLSRWDALAADMHGRKLDEIRKRGKAADMQILLMFCEQDMPPGVSETLKKFNAWLATADN